MLNTGAMKDTGGSRKAIKLLDEGAYAGRIVGVVDLGIQKRKAWDGVEKSPCPQFRVTVEVSDSQLEFEDGSVEDKPRWVSAFLNVFPFSNDKANSTKWMKAIDPKNELKGDWSQVLGKPLAITISHSKDGKYENITGVSQVMKGMPVDDLKNDAYIFDFDDPDMDVYNAQGDGIKRIIGQAVNFKGSKLEYALGRDSGSATTPVSDDRDESAPF